MADTEHVDARQTDETAPMTDPPGSLWWPFTGAADVCYSQHDDDGVYRDCCMRAGLAYALELHEQQLRADRPPLHDEYGIRTTYISTLIREEPVSDNLPDTLDLIAAADASPSGRTDVLSREPIRRPVGDWSNVDAFSAEFQADVANAIPLKPAVVPIRDRGRRDG